MTQWIPIVLQTLALLGALFGGFMHLIRKMDRTAYQMDSLISENAKITDRLNSESIRIDTLYLLYAPDDKRGRETNHHG